MSTVLLLTETRPGAREFFTEALRAAGHAVINPSDSSGNRALVPGVDVILADVELAVSRGWIGPGATPPASALVLTSAFAPLLAPWQPAFQTVLMPASAPEILAAVERVRSHSPPPVAPAPPPDALWSGRDRQLHNAGIDVGRADPMFASIAQLIAKSARVEMAIVAVVTSEKQHFVGQVGLPDDLVAQGSTPRAWSFCQHVVAANAPLVVSDASRHPALAASPLTETGMVRAYAGVPIRVEGVGVVGTVCVLSPTPREFSDHEMASLEIAAKLVEERLAATRKAPAPSIELSSRDLVEVAPIDIETGPTLFSGHDNTPSEAAPEVENLVGALLDGKYWVTAHLGGGGMSDVYLARDRALGCLVAIKILKGAIDDELLLREARLLAAIRHPSIVQVHGWGSTGGGGRGRMYLVLEYVRGVVLLDRIHEVKASESGFTHADVLRILRNLAGALDTMHGVGLVHGDVKPANILLDDTFERAVLIDFGLVMRMPGFGAAPAASSSLGGTPGYSAPEQLAPDATFTPSPRLDVYALGTIAYALLVGRVPFGNTAMIMRLVAQRTEAFMAPSLARPGIPEAVDAVIARALSADPARRQDSPSELTDALASALKTTVAAPSLWAPTTALSHGSAFATMRAAVSARVGAAREARILAGLDAEDRATWAAAKAGDEHFPTYALVSYLRAFSGGNTRLIEDVGVAIGHATVPDALRMMQIGRSPYTFLRAIGPIIQRFHNWARFELTQSTSGSATVQLKLDPTLAPEMCSLVGGIMRTLVTLAAGSATVEQALCVARGAAACEFHVSWPG